MHLKAGHAWICTVKVGVTTVIIDILFIILNYDNIKTFRFLIAIEDGYNFNPYHSK